MPSSAQASPGSDGSAGETSLGCGASPCDISPHRLKVHYDASREPAQLGREEMDFPSRPGKQSSPFSPSCSGRACRYLCWELLG